MRNPIAMPSSSSSQKRHVKSFDFLEPSKIEIAADQSPSSVPKPLKIGFELKNQRIPSETIQLCIKDREMVQLSDLESKVHSARRFWRNKHLFKSDLVVVGVVCHVWIKPIPAISNISSLSSYASSSGNHTANNDESSTLASKKGVPDEEQLVIVRLSDLNRTSVCLVVQHRMVSNQTLKFGDVLFVLNPNFINAVDGEGVLLLTKQESQICVFGESSEIGICQYRNPIQSSIPTSKSSIAVLPSLLSLKTIDQAATAQVEKSKTSLKHQAVCPNFVNINTIQYCEFHMYEMFSETKSKRMVLNDASGGALSTMEKRREFATSAKHLSDGIFGLVGLKWKISERNVKVVPSNDNAVLPTATQMYEDHDSPDIWMHDLMCLFFCSVTLTINALFLNMTNQP
jgi:hypothetical protein